MYLYLKIIYVNSLENTGIQSSKKKKTFNTFFSSYNLDKV